MKHIVLILVMLIAQSSLSAAAGDQSMIQSLVHQAPFEMKEISLPDIPDHSVSIIDFGAVGDGQTMNSKAIEKAISSQAARGGGRVIIPKGIWLTGPVQLESNIELYIDKGALLLFSRDFDDYPLVYSNWEGNDQIRAMSPINAVDVENIAITGSGIIDGSGDAWRPVK